MQQQISPKVVAAIVALVVIVVAVLAYRVYTGPSSTPVSGAKKKAMAPYGSGGPTAADLQKMREYNATHPGAASSYK